ncbi:saccharopine dehydrogenase family protein [Pseudoduganella sp. OTU4001]|uniref:saccharopine dehydrogenase family protein n=1 Tax=Pseudoduganella sp. OTU4001 TaxID=3043854 RepID=UPI00313F0A69
MDDWMIYGATGYTGEKIARKAVALGMRPVLAGRGENVRRLAAELGLPVRTFALGDAAGTRQALQGLRLVLNCAGPFSATAAPMVEACMQAGAHYLDITGEINVFEMVFSRDAAARARGVLLCPGVGFDVVPTDCIAAALKAALPDASELALGFDTDSPLSPGTAKTLLEGAPLGGKVRRNGSIIDVPLGYHQRRIDFGRGERHAVTIPWGDVSTAFRTTGIPNIACYLPMLPLLGRLTRWSNWSRGALGWGWVRRWLTGVIERKVHGPDAQQIATLGTHVWGEARNARGEVRTARVRVANGYGLTVDAALEITRHVLARKDGLPGGFTTPALLCGAGLVERLPGSGAILIT